MHYISTLNGMLKLLKSLIRKWYPALVIAYHTYCVAREMERHGLQQTPYGFKLMGNAAMQHGNFEREETSAIEHQLDDAVVFVDIGANIGFYTCLARSLKKHVIAIEPLDQNLRYLYANLNANGWNDVEVVPVGLSTRPGIAVLYGGGTGASLISNWAGTSDIWRRPIPVSTLDLVLGDRFNGKRVVIKIDVEGAEYAVLKGASKTLDMSPSPVWLVEICFTENQPTEVNPQFTDTFKIFWANGYHAYTVGADSRIVTPNDVDRWVSSRRRDFGYVSYLFEKGNLMEV